MVHVCLPPLNLKFLVQSLSDQCRGLLALFSQFYQTITMQTMTVTKIWTSVLVMYIQILWLYKVPLPSSGRRKSYQWSKSSIFFVSDHLNAAVEGMGYKQWETKDLCQYQDHINWNKRWDQIEFQRAYFILVGSPSGEPMLSLCRKWRKICRTLQSHVMLVWPLLHILMKQNSFLF